MDWFSKNVKGFTSRGTSITLISLDVLSFFFIVRIMTLLHRELYIYLNDWMRRGVFFYFKLHTTTLLQMYGMDGINISSVTRISTKLGAKKKYEKLRDENASFKNIKKKNQKKRDSKCWKISIHKKMISLNISRKKNKKKDICRMFLGLSYRFILDQNVRKFMGKLCSDRHLYLNRATP